MKKSILESDSGRYDNLFLKLYSFERFRNSIKKAAYHMNGPGRSRARLLITTSAASSLTNSKFVADVLQKFFEALRDKEHHFLDKKTLGVIFYCRNEILVSKDPALWNAHENILRLDYISSSYLSWLVLHIETLVVKTKKMQRDVQLLERVFRKATDSIAHTTPCNHVTQPFQKKKKQDVFRGSVASWISNSRPFCPIFQTWAKQQWQHFLSDEGMKQELVFQIAQALARGQWVKLTNHPKPELIKKTVKFIHAAQVMEELVQQRAKLIKHADKGWQLMLIFSIWPDMPLQIEGKYKISKTQIELLRLEKSWVKEHICYPATSWEHIEVLK